MVGNTLKNGVVEAALNVGQTPTGQLAWALVFASEDSDRVSPDLRLKAQQELTAFEIPRSLTGQASRRPRPLASFDDVRGARKRFDAMLRTFAVSREIRVQTEKSVEFALVAGELSVTSPDFVTACEIKLMQLIAWDPDHIRQCPKEEHGCGAWFLAERTDAVYCSKKCSGRKRIHEFRTRKKARSRKADKHGKR
jgi:hypothetical protein